LSTKYLKPSQIADDHMEIAMTQVTLGFWEWDLLTGDLKYTLQNKLNFGYQIDDDFTLDSVIKAILPEDQARREEALRKALSPDCGLYEFECRVRYADQSLHWLQISGTVIFESNIPKRIIGTSLDITEKKDLELLRHEVLNIANHELKTPLSAVKGYLQLLHRFVARTGNAQYEQIAHRALSATEKITRLLNDAFKPDATKANELLLNKDEINIEALTEEAIANTMLVHQSHQIELTSSGNMPIVEADRYRISQALTNLMNNAVKYSPDDNRVDVLISKSTEFIRVSIRDYGIGIPTEEQTKIFEKFYRVNNGNDAIEGSGIGLFLTSEIIARHGGHIGIEPTPGESGTTFYFTLPIKDS
jgi:PAS domain S-box-containing protein